MDRALIRLVLWAMPLLALVFYATTRVTVPLWGFGIGLCVYWAGLALILTYRFGWIILRTWLRPVWPGWPLAALCLGPVLGTGVAAGLAWQVTDISLGIVIAICAGAVVNGTLEELFWRRAILPKPGLAANAGAVALFTGWHLCLLAAAGITITGGPLALLGGAAILGTIWMAARLRTGTVGAGVLSHVAVNAFAFSELAARNLG